MDYDYDHLPREQRQRYVAIEERLRGASGRMPPVWEMERRKEHLTNIRPRMARRLKVISYVAIPTLIAVVLAIFAYRFGGLHFESELVLASALGTILTPVLIVDTWARWPFFKMPGSVEDLDRELSILATYIERKT
jgi:hypothetical protein